MGGSDEFMQWRCIEDAAAHRHFKSFIPFAAEIQLHSVCI